jgi:hypothetical protein
MTERMVALVEERPVAITRTQLTVTELQDRAMMAEALIGRVLALVEEVLVLSGLILMEIRAALAEMGLVPIIHS